MSDIDFYLCLGDCGVLRVQNIFVSMHFTCSDNQSSLCLHQMYHANNVVALPGEQFNFASIWSVHFSIVSVPVWNNHKSEQHC